MIRVLDSAGSTLVEWGRQQQQQRQYFSSITNTQTEPANYSLVAINYYHIATYGEQSITQTLVYEEHIIGYSF